jgi:hypothetical protein
VLAVLIVGRRVDRVEVHAVDPAVLGDRAIHQRSGRRLVAGVVVLAHCGPAVGGHERHGAVRRGFVEVADHDLGALRREPPGSDTADRRADPGPVAGAAGTHHDDLALEAPHGRDPNGPILAR